MKESRLADIEINDDSYGVYKRCIQELTNLATKKAVLSVSHLVLHTAQMAAPATGKFKRFSRYAIPGARFLTSAEIQTFAFAVAAYGFLAFFPFIVTVFLF